MTNTDPAVERIIDLHERFLEERDPARAYTMIRLARKLIESGEISEDITERHRSIELEFTLLLYENDLDEDGLRYQYELLAKIDEIHKESRGVAVLHEAVLRLGESRKLLEQIHESLAVKPRKKQQELEQLVLNRWGFGSRKRKRPSSFLDLERKVLKKLEGNGNRYDHRNKSTSIHTVRGGLPTLGGRR